MTWWSSAHADSVAFVGSAVLGSVSREVLSSPVPVLVIHLPRPSRGT